MPPSGQKSYPVQEKHGKKSVLNDEFLNILSLLKEITPTPTFLALLSYAKAISRLWP